MNFALDGRGINWYKGTGIGTYTENLLKNMLQKCGDNYFHVFWSGLNMEEYKEYNCKLIPTSKKHHRFFEEQYFPIYIKNNHIDLIHVPQNGISLPLDSQCKKVVTIHDLIPYIMPETVGKGYLLKFLKDMPEIISCSNAVITVSQAAKKDILRFFPINESKIHVIPLAADKKYVPLDVARCKFELKNEFGICNPFILYVGGFSSRKNVKTLLYAFKKSLPHLKSSYDLVLAGAEKDDALSLKDLAIDLGIIEKVKFTGFVKEDYLPLLYSSCDLFVYPSLYEGFGLPPLEAMCCGAPVLCSDSSSIPEVVGDGGILINGNDTDELSCTMIKILNNEDVRWNLKLSAAARSQGFSWSNTADKTLEVYHSI